MLRMPKHSTIEVVAPKEEEEGVCTCNITAANVHGQTAQYDRSNGFIISHSQMSAKLDKRKRSE